MTSATDINLDTVYYEDFSDISNEYSGNIDKNKLKTGNGNLKWKHKKYQRYQGQFFQDCLHGRGRYNWSKSDKSIVFEGNFYANKLEGYGKFYYNDCNVFEGLYKENVRFGPGVFTYKDGSQDVGMWMGKDLMRLCRVINAGRIPRIAETSIAKVKLLKYKKMVPICNETFDKARNILEMLEVHEDLLNQSEKLYNIHIRNTESNFFNSKLYETRYFCEKDCYIEVALTPSEIKTHHEEKDNLQNSELPDEIILEEASQNKFCCEEVPSDVVCVCKNPKQIRIKGIKLELKCIEASIKNAKWKVRIAKCKRRFARNRKKKKKKSTTICSTLSIQLPSGFTEFKKIDSKTRYVSRSCDEIEDYFDEEEMDVLEEYDEESTDEEDDIIADDGTDYKTACQLVIAAKHSLEILFVQQLKLIDKLNFEYNEIEEENENECTTQLTKRVLITDLLAWNNEELSIDMMKHAFLHRNFENGVPFCVSDILCGDRSGFNKIGIYEQSCGNFLTECSNGNCQEMLDIFYKYDLNPDLCDSRGNTGIIYAANQDKIKTVKILVNLGANIDSFNDDCFTPLGICMLRYLAIQHKVTDWEKAFLKYASLEISEDTDIPFEWRPHVSLVSLNTVQQLNENFSAENLNNSSRRKGFKDFTSYIELLSDIFGSNLDLIRSNNFIESLMDIDNRLNNIKSSYPDVSERFVQKVDDQEVQNYLFLTDSIKPPPEKKKKEKKKKEKKNKKEKKGNKKSDKSSKASSKKNKKNKKSPKQVKESSVESLTVIEVSPEDIIRNNKLKTIFNTIGQLLTSGANPNICEVPQPTLILALFTKNLTLVEQLLINKANPNVATLDENLSALHILVSIQPCIEYVEMMELVLNYSANPNIKASPCHWLKEKQELIGKRQLIEEDQGKTPLHLLCIRYDFKFDTNGYLNNMAILLINNGFDLKELYMGHTPLSIAMLRGNVELIKIILDSQLVNPNQRLGENMGMSLTLFILKRYSDILPDFQTCCDIIEILIKYKANPFRQILNIGNVIEFMIKEHEPPPSTKSTGKKDKKGKHKPDKKKKDKKSRKGKGKKGKGKPTQEQVKEILISFTRSVLERHLKGWIVKYLFYFVQKENYYDDVSETLAKFVNVEETIRIAQLLFNRGKLKRNESNYETLHDLIEMIINSNSDKVNETIFPSSQVNIHALIEHFQFKKTPKEHGKLNLLEPETMRHNENYNVCYHCLRKQQRQLFACPKCKLIYFCSQECNKLDVKVKSSFHKCKTLFYKEQEGLYLETKRLEQQEFERKLTNNEEIRFGPTEREIKQDKSKLLHLARQAKKCKSVTGLIFFSESDEDLRKVLNEKFGIGIFNIKDRFKKYPIGKRNQFLEKYGGKDKKIKLLIQEEIDHLKSSKCKSHKRAKSSDTESEHDENLNKNKKGKKSICKKEKTDGSDKDVNDKQKKSAKGLNQAGVVSNENRKGKFDKIKSEGLDYLRFATKNNDKISTKENTRKMDLDEKFEKSYGRSKSITTNKENMDQTKQFKNTDGKEKLDQLGLVGIENHEFVSGGKELELKRRLPEQYQYFLEKISEYWPDFDISLLFLPYACYRDGQLYYRFFTKQPVFMETYSTA